MIQQHRDNPPGFTRFDGEILVCLTDNSVKWGATEFQRDFVYVTKDGGDALLLALAPGGVYRAARVTPGAVRSYRTVSPLPAPCGTGGLFSVALSCESPRLAVSQHPAL